MSDYRKHCHSLDSLLDELMRVRAREGGDPPVIVGLENSSSDHSPVPRDGGVTVDMYLDEEGGLRYMTPEDRAAEERPDDFPEALEDAVRAVFLWPTC